MKTQSLTGGVTLSCANVLTENCLISRVCVCVCAFHYISFGVCLAKVPRHFADHSRTNECVCVGVHNLPVVYL